MPRLWVRILLFLSSYAPLLGIYAILNWEPHLLAAILCIFFGILFIASLFALFPIMRRVKPSNSYMVQNVQPRDGEVMNYVAAYIIPFASLAFNNWATLFAATLLFFILGTIYVTSNAIAINPILNLNHSWESRCFVILTSMDIDADTDTDTDTGTGTETGTRSRTGTMDLCLTDGWRR